MPRGGEWSDISAKSIFGTQCGQGSRWFNDTLHYDKAGKAIPEIPEGQLSKW